MTFNKKPHSLTFGKFYNFFVKYWDFKRSRNGYGSLQIEFLTSLVYMYLQEEWKVAGWDIDELEWICYNLDYNNKLFDPHNFINDKFAYVDHVKTCYYLDNNE